MAGAGLLLRVSDLEVELAGRGARARLLNGIAFEIGRGETLALVGESGSGKSLSAAAINGMLPRGVRLAHGSIEFDGQQLCGLSEAAFARIRGRHIGMIFQDPMSALNPTMRLGKQIAEVLTHHHGMSRSAAWNEAVRLLGRCRIADARTRARQYPCEFSGGMLQRVMIAIALAGRPSLLIADEPTTALDVTIQEQVLQLILELQREEGMAVLLITHDLGVVARMADRVAVMYAGSIVESGPVRDVFEKTAHPYTKGLLQASPRIDAIAPPVPIPGQAPAPSRAGQGCAFAPRCAHAMRICAEYGSEPLPSGAMHRSACWLQHPGATLPTIGSSITRIQARHE